MISYRTNTIPIAIMLCFLLIKPFYIGFIYDILMHIEEIIVIITVAVLRLDVIDLSHSCDEIITKA